MAKRRPVVVTAVIWQHTKDMRIQLRRMTLESFVSSFAHQAGYQRVKAFDSVIIQEKRWRWLTGIGTDLFPLSNLLEMVVERKQHLAHVSVMFRKQFGGST